MTDNNVHMISVLTSDLNGMIQFGYSSLLYLEGGAHEIDTNFNALTTMPLTAFTSFLNQWFMSSLYALVVAHQVAMCRVKGVLAIFDATGFTVSTEGHDSVTDSVTHNSVTLRAMTPQGFISPHTQERSSKYSWVRLPLQICTVLSDLVVSLAVGILRAPALPVRRLHNLPPSPTNTHIPARTPSRA